jgi:predicted nicotinamide N-methyase
MVARPARAGERILEIGCGLALASLVCHRQGADVTASDCHPRAGDFLADNVRLNGLTPLAYRHGPWAALAGAPVAGPHGLVEGRFDLIMGSDVLYERDDQGHLAGFIDRHIHPDAEVLIVDPDRGNRPAFIRRLRSQGFTLRETRLSALPPAIAAYKGRLLSFTRGRMQAT